ncbi:hypothetical protein BCR43DRAFT_561653 [Syncephalastrum racemosum]|uniref:HTH APSES-type domain-containing protein n=1 Tax=Syncephalastrum racemosum TaxID=13706 RepID=A0A1X2HPX7_SYNRA|nr:hypothetical protein BCR43DRAFT_561653 [Syncephalastrum racemosum]
MAEPGLIYKATYSGVPVYEMLCKGVAVMRRQSDAYLNATQILKVADFDKPQRTRILEREVQTGHHEKVQGGYGKYQGTWVPFERGVALARQFNVEDMLKPIFDFVRGDASPPPAPKHITAATLRPKKPREPRRKRVKREEGDVLTPADHSDVDELSSQSDIFYDSHSHVSSSPVFQHHHHHHHHHHHPAAVEYSTPVDDTLLPPPIRPNKRRPRLQQQPPQQQPQRDIEEEDEDDYPGSAHAQKLLQHFVSGSTDVPSILLHPPRDLDVNVIIDDEGHTSLHWAAAMGQLQTVRALIDLNADIYRVNYKGQTALMRSVLFTNNFDKKSFHLLLDMLQKTLFNIDKKDQTVFHHVSSTASWKGKVHASRYYMDCLIDKLSQNRSELISILNVQDVFGDTALTIAARIANKKLVRLLMEAGASAEIANEEGMTAHDYLAEVEKPPRMHEETHSSTTEQATRLRLRQKIDAMFKAILANERSTPAMSLLFDSFAGSYERDLREKEQETKEKRTELAMTQKRLEETRRTLDQLYIEPDLIKQTEATAKDREAELRRVVQFSQQQKLKRMVAEKENEEMDTDESAEALEATLRDLQVKRRQLMEDMMTLKAQNPGKRYQEYKRLISMCCNVAYENVDVMLSPLLASFDENT